MAWDAHQIDDSLDPPGNGGEGRRSHALIIAAASFALGIALANVLPGSHAIVWLSAAALAIIIGAIFLLRHHHRACAIAFATAAATLGAAHLDTREHHLDPHDLAAHVTDAPRLVRIVGTALDGPDIRYRTDGPLAIFDYRTPATYVPLAVEALIDRHGAAYPFTGEVLLRVDEVMPPFRAGDRIEAVGFLQMAHGPSNPGDYDYSALARALGQAGFVTVRRRDAVHITPAPRSAIHERWLRWRDAAQARAGGLLLSNLPEVDRPDRDGLLAALILGQRDRRIDGLDDTIRELGIGHLLAISGLHIGILVGTVLMFARLRGGGQRWHGAIIIAIVLGYLFLIEVRLPVMRAAIMMLCASLGLLCNRRWRVGNLIGLSALGLLLWRPSELFNAGFQLSFLVVLALVYLAPGVERRMFRPLAEEPHTVGRMLAVWLRRTSAAAVTAWAVATPITLHHFGIFSPLAVLLSVLALPVVAVLLVGGYAKVLLTLVLPSGALLLGIVLSMVAEIFLAVINAADNIPFSGVHVPPPAPLWSILAVAGVWWWMSPRGAGRRRFACTGLTVLTLWLIGPGWMPLVNRDALRIDMLAVGDGSCYLIRTGSETIIFDAGSASDLDVGRRSIVPTLRALGVREVDALILSHADIDHYGAALELVDAYRIPRIIITQQMLREARIHPDGPVAFVLDHLTRSMTSIEHAEAGAMRTFGESRWTWLHPPPGASFDLANDASMIIRIDVAGRAVLLAGDSQEQALNMTMAAHPDLTADVIELPHHGSYNEAAAALLRMTQPDVVLQSTGWSRWSRDRWAAELAEVERLVTARDGACTVRIAPDGTITTARFLGAEADGPGH